MTVLNKGIGGEEAGQMDARFDADVVEEAPDLVLWQVGSNSVLRDHPTPGEVIRQGVEQLKASGTAAVRSTAIRAEEVPRSPTSIARSMSLRRPPATPRSDYSTASG